MINNVISKQIWEERYKKGNETIEQNIERVAKYVSTNEKEFEEFKKVMMEKRFFPAGRTMSNAGIGRNLTLNNCFTLGFVEDSIEEIFEKVKQGALTQKAGGGTGYDFSKIRPKGTPTSNDAIASGVVSFIEAFDSQTKTILQGGRRGANMGVLNIYHPDIYDFIEAKSYEAEKLVHFNLSVMIDDDFMKAVENDEEIYLHYPVYNENGEIIKDESQWKIKKKVKAKELWDLIIRRAYDTGEPGVLFYDNINKDNNLYYLENITTSNPCSEYLAGTIFNKEINKQFPEGLMGACNLGSIFLHNHVENPFTTKAKVNWDKLKETIEIAVRMLDNIIDINKYPLKQFENYQKTFRTIGLGVTGLADALVMLGMRYGSEESIKFIDYLFEFITSHAYLMSTYLAQEKGSFPALDKEKFIQSNFIQKHLQPSSSFYGIWLKIVDNIKEYGIRNARMISIAPTGTLSLTFGENCSSGIEPIFSLSYKRKVKMGGQEEENIRIVDMEDYAYRLYRELKESGKEIIDNPPFVTAQELKVKEHLEVLKTIAYHVDMNISKTINIPTEYSFENTKDVYYYAWKNGIKGCTIFRPNPLREGVLLTEETKKEENTSNLDDLKRGDWEELPEDIVYYKRKVYIGCGKINLFIGYSPSKNKICDMYVVRSGNGGCEKNLQGMVIAMSGMLRLGGSLFNIEKAFEGLGSCNSFVASRVKGQKLSNGGSCGTAILNEIKNFIKEKEQIQNIPTLITHVEPPKTKDLFTEEERSFLTKFGEVAFTMKYHKCPLCGEKIAQQEGCYTCSNCGWTKCS